MARIDGWTDERVDYVISLLVRAERVIEGELREMIQKFLDEEA